ncbi:hypothetical protein BD769DRAFT_1391596 [Suillus cothurnatus]|nr:hypothetical protein BD769DRAFT_1391596 [Suillus cothurnatus]
MTVKSNHRISRVQTNNEECSKLESRIQTTQAWRAQAKEYQVSDCGFGVIQGTLLQWVQYFGTFLVLDLFLVVYATLLWNPSKSPSKFNFTGNQFSEVYAFHMNFLNEMEENAPNKFHKLMANIFEAIQKFCSNGATAVASHKDVMAFLDLDDMDNNE